MDSVDSVDSGEDQAGTFWGPAQVWKVLSGDRSRQVVTCAAAAAAAQVLLPTFAGPSFDRDGPPNVIQPAPYAFSVWFPIFAWSLGYAGYQARGSAGDHDLFRRAGWPLAAAFASAGVWAPLARSGRRWGAQTALVALAAFAETARRRAAQAESDQTTPSADLTAVVPAASMLSAWGLAATGVSLASFMVDGGRLRSGTQAKTAGSLLLLGLGAAGTAVAGSSKSPAGTSARIYAATVLWALTGVVVGQRTTSRSTALSAVVAAVPVVASLTRNARRTRVSGT